MTGFNIAVVATLGYLLGSISCAVLLARSRGVDILDSGSGNPGATNVTRALGSKWGSAVFVGDALKGFVAAAWPLLWLGDAALKLGIIGLFAAIIGHSFSIFLRFRGGKGVATTMGGLLALMPLVLLIGLAVWAAIYGCTRLVALASIAFALSMSLSAAALYGLADLRFTVGLVLGLLILVRHHSNIVRIVQGTENSFKK